MCREQDGCRLLSPDGCGAHREGRSPPPISSLARAGKRSGPGGWHSRHLLGAGLLDTLAYHGLRIRVGDDVYESSVAGQLAALASSV